MSLAGTLTLSFKSCVSCQQNPPRFDEDVELPLIKVVVLGASGVGKTALVKVRIRQLTKVARWR